MAIDPDIPECHSRKPDPDEPWRYVCPNCEQQGIGRKGLDASLFKCHNGCNQKWERTELLDQKTGDRAVFTDKYD
jgi:hypothetical protein